MHKIAILILFFNKLEETIACIESFLPSSQPIYLLNNGSDYSLWRALQKKFKLNKQVTLFHSDINLGVSAGRNYLIKNTSEPWLLIVDNDITSKEPTSWYSQILDYLKEDEVYDAYSLYIFNRHEDKYVKPIKVVQNARKITIETSEESVTNCFPGTGSVVNRKVFVAHGFFDESLFVGFEDFEYALRCMHSSLGQLKVLHINSIELIHDHRVQKTKADKKSVKIRYDENKIRESYTSIINKYQIEFDHNWEWWTRNQISDMNGKSFFARIKDKIFFKGSIKAWTLF